MKRLLLSLASAASFAAPFAMSAAPAVAQGRWSQERWESYDRWDSGRHNGYYYRNRWYYGAPPEAYYSAPGFRPGYMAWRRGAYLPPNYRGAVVYDYGRYHLRPPPRGYSWYRVDDDYLLAAGATGLIYDIIRGGP